MKKIFSAFMIAVCCMLYAYGYACSGPTIEVGC